MMEATYKVAMAAGRDAGNKSARLAGRTHWSQHDYDVAARVVAMLMEVPS